MRTYGKVLVNALQDNRRWELAGVEPQVAIRLKHMFPRIPKGSAGPFFLDLTEQNAVDLEWFMQRYPMAFDDRDTVEQIRDMAERHRRLQDEIAFLFSQDREPREFKINGALRDYQARGVELYLKAKRLLVGDDVGLGKTLIALGSLTEAATLPALVIVQTHLAAQWAQQAVKFLSARPHILKGTRPYPLPQAEVYICPYSRIVGWVDVLSKMGFKSIVFDEAQELRHEGSQKHDAAKAISLQIPHCLGLTATPIYNYGNEIFNVYSVIRPGALGSQDDFNREWCSYGKEVKDPKALGSLLREQHLFLRRTRSEVGRELPKVNKIVHTVDFDHEAVAKVEEICRSLAMSTLSGRFEESGQAARELDMKMRMVTGVSKAKYVAEYVRILLENKEPVVLAGWHRDVYDIWNKELQDFKPVMYTGSESVTQKEASKQAFIRGDTNLFIISLRSGVGLDGLQGRCKYVVFGELDWSPKVHEQVIGRIDRDGQAEQVTAIFLASSGGSDPLMIDLLGLKESQSSGIVDPFRAQEQVHSDGSRLKALAQYVLSKRAAQQQIVTEPVMAGVQ